jgi:hypothetical protein
MNKMRIKHQLLWFVSRGALVEYTLANGNRNIQKKIRLIDILVL